MFKRVLLALTMLMLPLATAAETYRVDKVVVEGNRRVESSAVLSAVTVEAGETAEAAEIDRNVRDIYKMGRFADVSAAIEQRDGENVLVFRLEERPLLRRIEFVGNEELSRSKLSEQIKLRTPELLKPPEVEQSVQEIKKAYVEEGYYAAEVEANVEVNDRNEATVTFEIDEGKKVLIGDIRFEGNTVFSDSELKKAMLTKERWIFSWLTGRGAYKPEVVQTDLEIIADKYFNRGYVRVKVKQPLITLSDDRETMDLLIEIEEGEQYRTGEIDFRGELLQQESDLREMVILEPGEVFSREQLRESVLAINDHYADLGYAYVNVSPRTQLDLEDRRIDLAFEIEPGDQIRIGRIEISGNTKTRDKVIRREMQLAEGDLYSATKMKESQRLIRNLGFFEEVDVATDQGADPAEMDVDVEVKEQPTGTFSLGFGYSSVDGVIGQGSVSQDNFLGRGWRLNLAGSFGGHSTTYQIGLLDPHFLDTDLTLGFDLYKVDREYNDYSKRATGGDLKFGFPVFDEKTRAFIVYRYEEKSIFDIDSSASLAIRSQEGDSTLSSIRTALVRNTTDFRLDPTTGYFTEGAVEFAGLGGTEKFAKYSVDHRHFFPYRWNSVFSIHGHLGYLQEVGGEEIPLDERYFLGGLSTLRGFETREVGPRVRQVAEQVDPATGEVTTVLADEFDFIGGRKAAYFNLEYTFPLIKDVGLKGLLFFDTGNAWSEDEDYFSEMRYSVGWGIRWFSPMGPLRLEWGYNLDPRDGEPQSDLGFSIGKFF